MENEIRKWIDKVKFINESLNEDKNSDNYIDFILDKILNNDALTQEEKLFLKKYSENSSIKTSNIDISEPNSTELRNNADIFISLSEKLNSVNPSLVVKFIGHILKKNGINAEIGYFIAIFTPLNGYFVKLRNNVLIDNAINALTNSGFMAEENPYKNSNRDMTDEIPSHILHHLGQNGDIIISMNSPIFKRNNLTSPQKVNSISNALKKFSVSQFSVIEKEGNIIINLSKKDKIDELILYLTKKGYEIIK